MKRFLFLTALLLTAHCSLLTLDTSAQSRTNRIYRNCPGTTTKAQVAIDVVGNITVTPCSGKTVITNGVKVYRALLTQTGTDAPVATVLENSLGSTVVWGRTSAGLYTATLAATFTADKTLIISSGIWVSTAAGIPQWVNTVRTSDTVITISTGQDFTDSAVFVDPDSTVTYGVAIVVYP